MPAASRAAIASRAISRPEIGRRGGGGGGPAPSRQANPPGGGAPGGGHGGHRVLQRLRPTGVGRPALPVRVRRVGALCIRIRGVRIRGVRVGRVVARRRAVPGGGWAGHPGGVASQDGRACGSSDKPRPPSSAVVTGVVRARHPVNAHCAPRRPGRVADAEVRVRTGRRLPVESASSARGGRAARLRGQNGPAERSTHGPPPHPRVRPRPGVPRRGGQPAPRTARGGDRRRDTARARAVVVAADAVDDATLRLLREHQFDGRPIVLVVTVVDDAALAAAVEAGVSGPGPAVGRDAGAARAGGLRGRAGGGCRAARPARPAAGAGRPAAAAGAGAARVPSPGCRPGDRGPAPGRRRARHGRDRRRCATPSAP